MQRDGGDNRRGIVATALCARPGLRMFHCLFLCALLLEMEHPTGIFSFFYFFLANGYDFWFLQLESFLDVYEGELGVGGREEGGSKIANKTHG